MKLVRIVHPEAGESMVPALAVPGWRASGWELASDADQTTDQQLVDDAPPHVSQLANAIGYALGQRGVQVTAADAIAAAYHVVDQDPAEPSDSAQEPATPADPAGDPAGAVDQAETGEPEKTGGEPTQQEAKPERRTRRASTKESE